MAAWVFTISGWLLLLAGVFVAWRLGWRDPGKGTRRCPRCWYDMSATGGLRCSECGHEAASEKLLRRRRMRRRWIAAGAMIALVSWFPFKWPEYQRLQRTGDAWLAFLPRTGVAMQWPLLLRWHIASSASPRAWWALPNARGSLNISSVMESRRLWRWQEWLKLRTCAGVIRESENDRELMMAMSLMRYSWLRPRWLSDTFMERFVDPTRGRPLRLSDAFMAVEENLDPKWAPHLLRYYEREHLLFESDSRSLDWLAGTGTPLDSLVPKLEDGSLYRERRSELAGSLTRANLSQDSRRRVIELLRRSNSLGTPSLLPRHIERIKTPDTAMARSLAKVVESNDAYAAILACASAAQAGIAEPDLLQSLHAAAHSSMRAVGRAARLATALLADEQSLLDQEVRSLIDFLCLEKRRDERMYEVTVLYEFARRGLLSDEVAIEGLVAVVDTGEHDNWWDVGRSAALLVETRADRAVGVRELLLRQIVRPSSAGYFAVQAFIDRGDAPRAIIEASRRFCEGMQEPRRSRELSRLARILPRD